MKKQQIALLLLTVLWISACTMDAPKQEAVTPDTPQVPEATWVEQVEHAHHKADFLKRDAIACDLKLSFGGKVRVDAQMTLATNSTWGKLDWEDGSYIHFEGDSISYSDDKDPKSARFAAYTWSYFMMLPYKMSDPGTLWYDYPHDSLNGEYLDAQKLTFEAGTGDAPDDWYITYVDPQSKLTEVSAYIVTAGGSSQAEAEVDPHAIRYHNYVELDGIPIAHEWSFWAWRPDSGLTKQLGEATLKNVRFLD